LVEKLKKEFLELLEKDVEFRYTVAGYLGLSEILKRLDRLGEGQNKLWEEVKNLREGQNKLWENQNRLWEEVKNLREGQNKLWENQNKLWEEARKLWVEVKGLRENQEKLWIEVRGLRENQEKLWIEVKELREDQKKLWVEVKGLRENQEKLWIEVKELREDQRKLRASFESFGKALGVTLEDYTASLVKLMLEDMGYPDVEVGRKPLLFNGEIYEINIFCEEPLTVGEVTLYIGDLDEARRELEKLQKRIEVAEKVTGKKATLKILAVANTSKEILDYLKTEAKKQNIKLVYGKELIT